MIGTILGIYTNMFIYYDKKWRDDKIDLKYKDWEQGQEMKQDLGYKEDNFKRIPKRKIRNRASRIKHGY